MKRIPSNYSIGSDGTVYNHETGNYLKGVKSNRGYVIATLYGKGVLVHRLVASAYVHNPNPAHKVQVNHIDGDKTNNHHENLEWVTPRENTRHAIDTGLRSDIGSSNHASRLDESDVKQIKVLGLRGVTINKIADQFSVDRSTISDIFRRKTWKHVSVSGEENLKTPELRKRLTKI